MGSDATELSTQRWAAIELVGIDVDGVLTDGGLTFDESGALSQTFFVRDGYALVAARKAGLKIAWISGRPSQVAMRRAQELGIEHCLLQCNDKAAALVDLQKRFGLSREQCCFIGDDLPDLPAFAVCGLNVAVADADAEVTARADYVTRAPGGRGAVREVLEAILRAKGNWRELVDRLNASAPVENLQR